MPIHMLCNLQVLRAVASLLVVLAHLQPVLGRVHPALAWVGLGRAGVDLFFVISGFVMVYTTDRAEPSPGLFAYRRIARIVPLYWLITCALFALAVVAPGLFAASRPDPVWLAKSLAFIPFDKGDGTANPLLPVGWSLNYEMAFYAIFALSLLAGRRWRYWIAGLAVTAAALLGLAGAGQGGPAAAFYTQPIVLEFAAGMALGALFPRLGAIRRGGWKAAAVIAVGALLAALLASGLAGSEAARVAIAGAAAVGLLAIALALENGGAQAGWRPALLVGDASYSIYLTHLFVTQAAVAVALGLGSGPLLAGADALAALGAVAAGGIIVYRLVELPLTRALKTFPANVLAALARKAGDASAGPLS